MYFIKLLKGHNTINEHTLASNGEYRIATNNPRTFATKKDAAKYLYATGAFSRPYAGGLRIVGPRGGYYYPARCILLKEVKAASQTTRESWRNIGF